MLEIANPSQAAEVFVGMVIGGIQMRLLMGLASEVDGPELAARAREAATRFVRAYARGG
jgi:hypothetical protein